MSDVTALGATHVAAELINTFMTGVTLCPHEGYVVFLSCELVVRSSLTISSLIAFSEQREGGGEGGGVD